MMRAYDSSVFLLLGLLHGGLCSSVLAHPGAGEKSKEAQSAAELYGNPQSADYEEIYSDDEESPAEQVKATPPNSNPTMMPYFEEKTKIIYTKPGERIVLECPVKNYDEKKHTVLWYKENNTITNGLQTMGVGYEVDKSFNLTINQTDASSGGNYFCSVMPQNVRRHIVVKLGEEPPKKVGSATGKESKPQTAGYGKMQPMVWYGGVIVPVVTVWLQKLLATPQLLSI